MAIRSWACHGSLLEKQLPPFSVSKGASHQQTRLFGSHRRNGVLRFGHAASRSLQVTASSAISQSSSSSRGSKEAEALSSITVLSIDGSPTQFQHLWEQNEGMAVVAFLRHFGCFFCWEFAAALRDAKPKFDAAGVKLIAVGVGTPDKAQILAEKLPFPKDILYADPDRKAYNALGLYYGLGRTFLNPASAKVLSRLGTLQKSLKDYTFDATPKDKSSVLQQGGLFIFKGTQLLYARKDEGTGDHSSLDDVLNICCSTPVS